MKFDNLKSGPKFDRLSLYPERFPREDVEGEDAKRRYRTTVKAVFEYVVSHEIPIQTYVYYPHRASDNLPCWERIDSITHSMLYDDTYVLHMNGNRRFVTEEEPIYTSNEFDYFLLLGL